MSRVKINALMGASALVLALLPAAAAVGQTTSPPTQPATTAVTIYGGGGSLLQPYLRQAQDCFGTQAPAWDKSSPPIAKVYPYFSYTGYPVTNCATTHPDANVTFQFQGVSSATSILALYEHNPHDLDSGGNYTVSGTGLFWPTLHYGASEIPLQPLDVGVYNNGGKLIPTPNDTTNIAGPNNLSGTIANPLANYGPVVQFPILDFPVVLAYSPIYKESLNTHTNVISRYQFRLSKKSVTVEGIAYSLPVLKLTAQTYCEIFNGYITDWSDSRIAAENSYTAPAGGITVGGVFHAGGSPVTTIEDPKDPTPAANFSVPIELVGRSDTVGSTGIFTRHLEAECPTVLASGETNKFTAGANLPSAVVRGVGTGGPGSGLFTVEPGITPLAAYLQFVAPTASSPPDPFSHAPSTVSGKVGYLGPDNVIPYSPTATSLYAVALQNNFDTAQQGHPVYVLPGPSSAAKAFGDSLPPQSDSTGGYTPANTTNGLRSDPSAWVEPLSATTPIATAGDTLSGAYPITGTANVLAYTCYADATANSVSNVGMQLNQFLTWYETNGVVINTNLNNEGIIASRGFGVMPAGWRKAIKETFLHPTTSNSGPYTKTNGLKLWISPKSDVVVSGTVTFKHNQACNSVPGAN